MKTYFLGFGLIAIGLVAGFAWIVATAPASRNVASVDGGRSPAAIRRTFDFSELEGPALNEASKQRLVSALELMKDGERKGVRLGHFVVKGPTGEKEFACDHFPKVILEFTGEGVASSGEKPIMSVEGTCQLDANVNLISPLWIPVAKISGRAPINQEFDFSKEDGVKMRFDHMAEAWPSAWVLTKLRLVADGEEEVVIDSSDLREMTRGPLVLE